MTRPIALKQKKRAGVNTPNVAKNKKLGESSPPKPSLIRPSIVNDKMSEGQRCLLTQAPITVGKQSQEFPQPYRTATWSCLPLQSEYFGTTIPNRGNKERRHLPSTPLQGFLYIFVATFLYFYFIFFFSCHFFSFFLQEQDEQDDTTATRNKKTIDKTGTQTTGTTSNRNRTFSWRSRKDDKQEL